MKYSANVLLTALVLLSGLATILFLSQDKLLHQEAMTQAYYGDYLKSLNEIHQEKEAQEKSRPNKDVICNQKQTEKIEIRKKHLQYLFQCVEVNLFKDKTKLPTKKHLLLDEIEDNLNIDEFSAYILQLDSLDKLPKNTDDKPYIIKFTREIENGILPHSFYGLIITEHPFNLNVTRDKIYGLVISAQALDSTTDRSVTRNRNVISTLSQLYQHWYYVPNSQRIVGYAEP
ncbi:hypothetical protein A4G20_09200 [Pasteurellaceae bacterium RH1A]|nr:hypothetical protein A4G20_09200 [Pasteurellaceae bacterium RH1A]